MKKTISERAVIARINRVLRQNNEQLRRPRAASTREMVGDLFIWDWRTNMPGECFVDPEDLGRRLGVLADDELVREVGT